MNKRILLIQFTPFFPPHVGGVESVSKEISYYWNMREYGESIIVTSDIGQNSRQEESLYYKGKYIGYRDLSLGEVLIFPSFEIIPGFPMPKFWLKTFWYILSYLGEKKSIDILVATHTRFFLSSFLGGFWARHKKHRWIHIEHGSAYIELSSVFKNKIAYLYDHIIGKWIFGHTFKNFAISQASLDFVKKEFGYESFLWYRGISFSEIITSNEEDFKKKFPGKLILGYVGRIVKWKNVETFLNSYSELSSDLKNKFQVIIVGGGEDLKLLKLRFSSQNIFFTGKVSADLALAYQSQFDIHVHTSGPGGGLATTLLQAMYFGSFIIATPFEGAKEVIFDGKNGILLDGCTQKDFCFGIKKALHEFGKKDKYALYSRQILSSKFDRIKNIELFYQQSCFGKYDK